MIMGEMWWRRMVNAVRFLDDAEDLIAEGKSVILNFSGSVPWGEILTEELSQRIGMTTDKSFVVRDASVPVLIKESDYSKKADSEKKSEYKILPPGDFLFREFCSDEDKKLYWPTTHKSYVNFLASFENSKLNRHFLCIVGLDSKSSSGWVSAATEYLRNTTLEEHGVFILVTKDANVRSSDCIECLQFSDYITDYDCMMLCLTTISELECSRTQKLYIAEVASNIADNNIEIAGLLASSGTDLIENPLEITTEIFEENHIKTTKLEEKVNTGVWEAQIRLVFPRLENFRSRIAEKYERQLRKSLPITNSMNEVIREVNDLEISQLCTLCQQKNIGEYSDREQLKKMRSARNALAHLNPLSFKEISDLGIFS
ncbi:MAG: hypothetical protein NC340_09610 [Ruminococcus flavefaciens]|nr:hypothetical protein [Ruminococcus flavefaciens]MCM1229822.1 hypothetical protein [Ruminococcus flavefaciens]